MEPEAADPSQHISIDDDEGVHAPPAVHSFIHTHVLCLADME